MSNTAIYKKTSVLIVDDQKSMLMLLHGLLKDLGFEQIDAAADGVLAVGYLKNKVFDLVISDWNMPNMDGIELLKYVRSTERIKTIPFILLTAESKKENIIVAKQAGVNNYIVKPLTMGGLKQKVDATLGLM